MKVPTYKKYGISKKEFDNIKFRSSRISFLLTHEIPLAIGVVLGIIFWIISYKKLNPTGFLETAGQIFLFGTMGIVCVGIPMLIFKGIEKLYYAYLGRSSDSYKGTLKYEADREKFGYWKIRRDESYWKLLDGLSFENEVINVFSKMGYKMKSEIPAGTAGKKYILGNKDEDILLMCKTGKGITDFKKYINDSEINNNRFSKTLIVSPDNFTAEFVNEAKEKSVKLISIKELVDFVRTIKQ